MSTGSYLQVTPAFNMWGFIHAILVLQVFMVTCHREEPIGDVNDRFDLRCFSCHDAADPMSCISYETCGAGEECFTRRIIDHFGKTAFRLGCESKALCNLYTNAVNIVGRRAAGPDCFQCCDGDNCNSQLCPLNGTASQGKTTAVLPVSVNHGFNVTATTTVVPSTNPETTSEAVLTTHANGNCESTYLTGTKSCYLFINSSHTWHEGDVLCSQLGGALLSINDKAEDNFITGYLRSLPVSSVPAGYWIGGLYDQTASKWMWRDGTEMTYVRWGPNQPMSYRNYHVNLANPHAKQTFHDWEWNTDVEYDRHQWVICEHAFS